MNSTKNLNTITTQKDIETTHTKQIIREELLFCRIYQFDVFHATPIKKSELDELYFLIKHDSGASAIFRFEFGEFFDGGFLVLDYLFDNPSKLDEEMLLYIRLHLINKLWNYAKIYNPDVWGASTYYDQIFSINEQRIISRQYYRLVNQEYPT